MNKRERILGTCAIITSMLPYLLIAISLQYLPNEIPIISLLPELGKEVIVSKYNNLYMGLVSLVPMLLVIATRFLKSRLMVDKNFTAVVIASLVLSFVFLGLVIYSLLRQASLIDIFYKVDVISVVVIGISLVFSFFGSFMPFLKQNFILGINNKYTLGSNKVWTKVHTVAADVFSISFLLETIPMPFMPGWMCVILFLAVNAAFTLFIYFYSKRVSEKYSAISLEENKDEVKITDK